MVQIVKSEPSPISTGLGQGLQLLGQLKLQQLMGQQQARGLVGFFPQQDINAFSQLNPQMQNQLFSALLERGGLNPQNGIAALNGLGEQQGLQEQMQMPQQQQTIASVLSRPTAKQQSEINKETLPFYTKTIEAFKGAHNADKRLDRMEELIKHGSLPLPETMKFIQSLEKNEDLKDIPVLGPLLGAMVTKPIGRALNLIQRNVTARDMEEFEKLSQDFTRDAKAIYGSRVTNYDLENFLKMIPSLMQTDRGKLAVIRNMRNFNEAAKLQYNAMKDIIRRNGGRRPANLELLANEAIAPQLDKLAEGFKFGLSERFT